MRYTLKDSYAYEILRLDTSLNIIGGQIIPNLSEFMIEEDQKQMFLNDFKHKVRLAGKEALITAVDSNKVIFVFEKKVVLPAWCFSMGSGKGIVVAVNIASKARYTRDNTLTYQVKEIFGLGMFGLAIKTFTENERAVTYNRNIIQELGAIYTRILLQTMDALYSIQASLDSNRSRDYSGIAYLVARFFLRRLAERTNKADSQEHDLVMSILSKIDSRKFSVSASTHILDAISGFPEERVYENINVFLGALSDHFFSLNKMEPNHVLRKIVLSIGEKFLLGLESMQYLLGILTSYVFNGNVVQDFAIKNILGNDGNKYAVRVVTELLSYSSRR